MDRYRASDEFCRSSSCAAVLDHVPKGFLHDPIEAEGDIVRNWSMHTSVGKLDSHIMFQGELST